MLTCEWWMPETKLECTNTPAVIVDCDICKNAWVCWDHVGLMIRTHFSNCQHTLHVEPLNIVESVLEEHPHGSE